MRWILMVFALGLSDSNPRELLRTYSEIEINHVVNGFGTPVFDQIIVWDWSREKKRKHVSAWRMLRNCRFPTLIGALRWQKRVETQLRKTDFRDRQAVRGSMLYRGDFVYGPWYPTRTPDGWRLDLMIDDVKCRCLATSFRETWTTNDPERDDRDHWPETNRRGFEIPEGVGDE